MFKIGIDIQKAKREGNVLKIEGVASSPVIDLDGERFSKEAVEMMKSDVLKGNIPIRVEHENKFYSDIGVWKEASIIEGDKLFVKGEIDLELSMARDLEVLLRKGKKICMSVGGRVVDAVSEFVKEAGKYITTYKDIKLSEISIVKNPANQETNLAIAKSFNVEAKEETEVAKTLTEAAAELIKVPTIKEAIVAKSVTEVFKAVGENIKKDWESGETVEAEVEEKGELSEKDLKYIAMFIQAAQEFKNVEYTYEERDAIIQEMFEAELAGLPDESYVLELLPARWFPHHNKDYTVNAKWLKMHLWAILSGYTWLTPKEYRLALTHLWRHYIMDVLGDSYKKTEKIKENILEKQMTEEEVTTLFKACYEYKVLKSGARPQVAGNDLSDKEISKMANAYKTLNERVRYQSTAASISKNIYSLNSKNMELEKGKQAAEAAVAEVAPAVTTEVAPATEAAPAVAEVAPETATPAHGVTVTEKAAEAADGAEDVVKTEEAGADASQNNTGSEEVAVTSEAAPVAEPSTEEPATTETVPEVAEVAKTEEAPVVVEEVKPEESTATVGETVTEKATPQIVDEAAILAKAKALVDSAIAEAIAPFATALEAIKSHVEGQDEVVKSRSETIEKNFELHKSSTEAGVTALAKSVELIAGQISAMNTSIAFRKSKAVAIEKTSQASEENDINTAEGFNKAVLAEMEVNGGEYAKARNTVIARLQAPQN